MMSQWKIFLVLFFVLIFPSGVIALDDAGFLDERAHFFLFNPKDRVELAPEVEFEPTSYFTNEDWSSCSESCESTRNTKENWCNAACDKKLCDYSGGSYTYDCTPTSDYCPGSTYGGANITRAQCVQAAYDVQANCINNCGVANNNCNGKLNSCYVACDDSRNSCNDLNGCTQSCEASCPSFEGIASCETKCLANPTVPDANSKAYDDCVYDCAYADQCFINCYYGCNPDGQLSGIDCDRETQDCKDNCDDSYSTCNNVPGYGILADFRYKVDACLEQGPWLAWLYSGQINNSYYTTDGLVETSKPFCKEGNENCKSPQITFKYDWDYSQESCDCGESVQKVKFDWLDESVESIEPSISNNCCGNDPREDVGMVLEKGGDLYLCVQEPEGWFRWAGVTNEEVSGGALDLERGNVYRIFDNDTYDQEQENIFGSVHSAVNEPNKIEYEFLSDGEKWHICTDMPELSGDRTSYPALQGSHYIKYDPDQNKIVTIGEDTGYLHDYMCAKDYDEGKFVECRGDSTSYNKYSETGAGYNWKTDSRQLGEGLFTLYSFEGTIPSYLEPRFDTIGTTPFVADYTSRYKVYGVSSLELSYKNEGSTFNSVGAVRSELKRNDFSNSILEGYVLFDSVATLDLILSNDDGELGRYKLEDYIHEKPSVGEWLFFSIPVDFYNVKYMSFEIDTGLYNLYDEGTYNFYLDNIVLTPASGDYYCGREVYELNGRQLPTYNWFDSRDENKFSCSGSGVFSYLGEDAGCCGDNPGETFEGEDGICLDSSPIEKGVRFQLVNYGISTNINSNPIEQDFICTDKNSECKFPLPRLEDTGVTELFLDNPNPDFFDMYFEHTRNVSTTKSGDFVVVRVKYYEYLSMGEQINYCGNEFNSIPEVLAEITESNFGTNDKSGCSLESNFLCSLDEGWTTTLNAEHRDGVGADGVTEDGAGAKPLPQEFVHLKSVPPEMVADRRIPESCCPEDYCWNGEKCIEDEIDEPHRDFSFLLTPESGYRCIGGEWKVSIRKYAPLGTTGGYCPEETQCFVSAKGNYDNNGDVTSNPQCINDTQSVGDHYCDAGSWTSRTKTVAKSLLDTMPSGKRVSLYCDNFNNVFNYADNVISGSSLRDVIRDVSSCATNASGFGMQPCMNNFCVIETAKGIAFGTSLNVDLDDPSLNITELFGIESVSDCDDEGELERCYSFTHEGVKMNWYYDSNTGTLINSEYTLKNQLNWFESFFGGMKDFFLRVGEDELQFSYGELTTSLDLKYLNTDQRYDVLYYLRSDKERVTAIKGEVKDVKKHIIAPYVGVKYESFGFTDSAKSRDICSYVESYDQVKTPLFDLVCSESSEPNKPFYVFAVGNKDTPINVWSDLTSKLRVLE